MDYAHYVVAALAVVVMVVTMLLLTRHEKKSIVRAPSPSQSSPHHEPAPIPTPRPKRLPREEGGDELAPYPEKVPPVPMPGMPDPLPVPTFNWEGDAGPEIDKSAAAAALKSVPYKDCGTGGPGKVQVTFGPTGSVQSAVVTSGDYDGATKSCIANRFKGAKVPPFGGGPKMFGWSITL